MRSIAASTSARPSRCRWGRSAAFSPRVHRLQAAFPAENSPIRTALVTARSAPAHKRVILTLRKWGVRIDEALFLGGRDKGPFLDAFGADIFFDDSPANVESARKHVATGHVPHGVSNRVQQGALERDASNAAAESRHAASSFLAFGRGFAFTARRAPCWRPRSRTSLRHPGACRVPPTASRRPSMRPLPVIG